MIDMLLNADARRDVMSCAWAVPFRQFSQPARLQPYNSTTPQPKMDPIKPYQAAACVILVFSLLIFKRTSRHHKNRKQRFPNMVSWVVYNMCHDHQTVSSELANDPTKAPYKVFQELYGSKDEEKDPDLTNDEGPVGTDELRKAKECGNWGGAEPSELFLKVWDRLFFPRELLCLG